MRVRREVLQNAGRMEEADGVHVGTDGSDRRWARDQVKISSSFPFSKLLWPLSESLLTLFRHFGDASHSWEQAHDLVLESQGDYAVGVPCREAGLGRTELSNALTNFALASESEAGKGEGEGASRKEAVRDLELALKLIQPEKGRADAVAEV